MTLILTFHFEEIPDDHIFHGSTISDHQDPENKLIDPTWAQLKKFYVKYVLASPELMGYIEEKGFRRVYIGSGYYMHRQFSFKPRDRILSISPLHLARFIKR